MAEKFKYTTFDKIELTGKVDEELFFYPWSNVIFDMNGDDIGRYSVNEGEFEAIIDE